MSTHDLLTNLLTNILLIAVGVFAGIQISARLTDKAIEGWRISSQDWASLYKHTVENQINRHYAVMKFLVARGQCTEQDVLEAEKIYSENPNVK